MNAEQAVRVIELTQAKLNELFDEIKAELTDDESRITGTDRTAGSFEGEAEVWSLDDAALSGAWEPTGAMAMGNQTYTWPDGTVDQYSVFFKYEGRGEFEGMRLGLGYLDNGDVIGFVLGAQGGSKRGITYFFPTDDYPETREVISMIRGGGPNGRSGFGPDDLPPPAYAGFETAILRDRKTGKWNVLGVVVDSQDQEAMLNHTAIQARLRSLA